MPIIIIIIKFFFKRNKKENKAEIPTLIPLWRHVKL